MKILAVCGFGVGSSMVLKMSLDKVIKELGLKATVENTDLSTAKATMADVYFTSIICQI
ncbi:TPA: PTS sugar transporter subunit IIB, partial [Enterococcus faecium]|nr:PTS sugar transporter subunit IIB [Enterococcus faecium]